MIETPFLATDGIIKIYDRGRFQGIVLIERKNDPKGIALPGGFVEVGESVEEACRREMREETGLEIVIERLLGVYSDPRRDPRFHVASVVFVGRSSGVPRGGDDAKRAFVVPIEGIPWEELLFDHAQILQDFI
ncbi:MAG: NUDIX hydrolase [Epsilonproteobacteria bacterium]|nr:NUDIX hydrolase [Campylobacterota bacterium]NPA57009.1 NUDIX hydrolase [Campylobacterota bacterium]